MHKSATKCNETLGKWCKNKHGASKILDTLETYQGAVSIMPNAPNAELVEVKGELKKMNKQLRQLIELKNQANLMAGCFFVI
jgi:hypothetical protein